MKKILNTFSSNLLIVVMLGLVSITTAWAAVQSSLHAGIASDANSEYALILEDANNLWITAEVKYRDDMTVWKDKQVRVLIDGMSLNDIYSDIRTNNGSYELYEFGLPCFLENPKAELTNCEPYIDSVYNPYDEMFNSGDYYFNLANTEGGYSKTLQMLTVLFPLALFLLGITSVMQTKNLVAYLVMFSIVLWLFGLYVLLTVPATLL